MEVTQSVQQQFHKQIKEYGSNKQEIANAITQILENSSLNTFSEFLQLSEIMEVSQ